VPVTLPAGHQGASAAVAHPAPGVRWNVTGGRRAGTHASLTTPTVSIERAPEW